MANPSKSPTPETSLTDPLIADIVVQRLIEGTDTETLAFYDVSDCQLYGRKHRRKLSNVRTEEAKSAGCEPTVYQAIHWFCLAYIPVWPLGTYVVMPFADHAESHDEAVRYRGVRISPDHSQIALHYVILAALIVAAGIAVWCCWI